MPKRRCTSFQEKPFLYDWEEYQSWLRKDQNTIESMLSICGDLGKKSGSIANQAHKEKGSQHYPEVKYAVDLIKGNISFQKENIVYENYTLSYKYANELIGKSNLHAKGTSLLRKVFSDEFFKIFDRLYEINADSIEPACKNMHVDLCAINNKPRYYQVYFSEVKKYNRGENKTELLARDQLLVMAFVRYIIDTLGSKAFLNKIYKVKTELIVFVAMDDSRLINLLKANPREHCVEFAV